MPITTPWVYSYYGTDLAWKAGATPLVLSGSTALVRSRRIMGLLVFQIVVSFDAAIVAAAATAGAGAWSFALPSGARSGIPWPVAGSTLSASTGYSDPQPVWLVNSASASSDAYVTGTTPPATSVSRTSPHTWAAGDALLISGVVECFDN